MESPKKIVWDLSVLEDAHAFDQENFAYSEELNGVLGRLEKLSEKAYQLKKNWQKKDNETAFHNTITITGSRGSGKTTFIQTLMSAHKVKVDKSQPESYTSKICFLKMIDPSMIDQPDMFLINIYIALLEQVDSLDCEAFGFNSKLARSFDDFEEAKRNFSLKLRAFLSSDRFHHWPSEDEELLNNEMTNQARRGGVSIRSALGDVLYNAIRISGKNVFVLPIDDLETDLDRTFEAFETIRKYLTSPFLVPIVTCDLNLAKNGLVNSYIKSLRPLLKSKNLRTDGVQSVTELANHNLDKVFSPFSRVYLTPIKEKVFIDQKTNESDFLIKSSADGFDESVSIREAFFDFISRITNIDKHIVVAGIRSGFIKEFLSLLPTNNRGFIIFLREVLAFNHRSRGTVESQYIEYIQGMMDLLITFRSNESPISIRDLRSVHENNSEQKFFYILIEALSEGKSKHYGEVDIVLVLDLIYQALHKQRPEKGLDYLLILTHMRSLLSQVDLDKEDKAFKNQVLRGITTRNFVNSLLSHNAIITNFDKPHVDLIYQRVDALNQRDDFEVYGVFHLPKKQIYIASFESRLGLISDLMKVPLIDLDHQPGIDTSDPKVVERIKGRIKKNLALKAEEDTRSLFNTNLNDVRFCNPKQHYSSKEGYQGLLERLCDDIWEWSKVWSRQRWHLSNLYSPRFWASVLAFLNNYYKIGRTKVLSRLQFDIRDIVQNKLLRSQLWEVDDYYEFCFMVENFVNHFPNEEAARSALFMRYPELYGVLFDSEQNETDVESFSRTLEKIKSNGSELRYRINENILKSHFGRFDWERSVAHEVFNRSKLIYDIREVIHHKNELGSEALKVFNQELNVNCFDFETFFNELFSIAAESSEEHLLPEEVLMVFFPKEEQREEIYNVAESYLVKGDYQGFMDLIRLHISHSSRTMMTKLQAWIKGSRANQLWQRERALRDERVKRLKAIFTVETFKDLQAKLPKEDVEEDPFWQGTFFQRCTRYLIASIYLREVSIVDPNASHHSLDNPPDFLRDILPWARGIRHKKQVKPGELPVMPETIEIAKGSHATYTEFFYTFPMIRMHLDPEYRKELEKAIEAARQAAEPEKSES
jgi:hypothetical protein